MNAPKTLRKFLAGPPMVLQSDLARRVGVLQSTISKVAAGKALPSLALATALEREAGVPVCSWNTDFGRYLRRRRAA